MKKVMMKCGHAANAEWIDKEGNRRPCCIICDTPEAREVDDTPPSLEGRQARCSYCGRVVPSHSDLAFFEHRPDKEYDKYYCGCRGWD